MYTAYCFVSQERNSSMSPVLADFNVVFTDASLTSSSPSSLVAVAASPLSGDIRVLSGSTQLTDAQTTSADVLIHDELQQQPPDQVGITMTVIYRCLK